MCYQVTLVSLVPNDELNELRILLKKTNIGMGKIGGQNKSAIVTHCVWICIRIRKNIEAQNSVCILRKVFLRIFRLVSKNTLRIYPVWKGWQVCAEDFFSFSTYAQI